MEATPAIALRGVGKRFGDVAALVDVELTVAAGEIHALVGENGAGKSTLMNVLYGLVPADGGTIALDGETVDRARWSPAAAIAAGIGMVHQHFMLVPTLSVAENVVLGAEPTTGRGLLDLGRAREEIGALAARYGLDVDPGALVGTLSVGQQQRVEILKLLYRGARRLILDEPTAVLTPPEVAQLFDVLRGMRDAGQTVIVVTHKLGEVKALCDRLTVLRRGRVTGRAEVADVEVADIARMMVGRDVLLSVERTPATPGPARLRARGLTVEDDRGLPAVRGVDLELRSGEILGIAGVEGNGQTELVEALVGLRAYGGAIERAGADGSWQRLPAGAAARQACGVAHVPEDRHRRGLVMAFDVADNAVLGRHREPRFAAGLGWRRVDAVSREATRLIGEYDIRPTDPSARIASLSGGNQQKVVVARELARTPSVLVAAQPTRGVDVGAIESIHRRLLAERDRGAAILLVSAELDEILSLADRIAVLYRGAIARVVDAAEADCEQLGLWMAGQAQDGRGDGGGSGS